MQPLEWLKLLRWIGLVSNDETTSNITWNIEIIEYLMQQEINNAQLVGYGLVKKTSCEGIVGSQRKPITISKFPDKRAFYLLNTTQNGPQIYELVASSTADRSQ